MSRWDARPREALPTVAPSAADVARAAERTRRDVMARRDRLEAARANALDNAITSPEDSSPAIRRMLGYDRPARPPHRWELQPGWDGQPRYVDMGPVDPPKPSDGGRAR